jgi:Xaa-Pro aminopeptidase
MTKGLIDLGILRGSLEQNLEQKTFLRYFMHGTGHFLGLDVHDVGVYKNLDGSRAVQKIQQGMCLTVEPGLYFDLGDETVAKQYRGIGVRIEDDIAILKTTQKSNKIEVLTKALEK